MGSERPPRRGSPGFLGSSAVTASAISLVPNSSTTALLSSNSPSSGTLLARSARTLQQQLGAKGRTARWDERIPPLLRPAVRAYLVGYASAVGPRLLALLLQHLTGARRKKHDAQTQGEKQQAQQNFSDEKFLVALGRTLKGGCDPQRFPTFCAVLAGGSTLFEVCKMGVC